MQQDAKPDCAPRPVVVVIVVVDVVEASREDIEIDAIFNTRQMCACARTSTSMEMHDTHEHQSARPYAHACRHS